MDATYRADLKEMNELNFARFDATVGQRFAESNVKWAEFQTQVVRQFGRLETQLAEARAEALANQLTQTRWLVGLWATVALAILGLYLR